MLPCACALDAAMYLCIGCRDVSVHWMPRCICALDAAMYLCIGCRDVSVHWMPRCICALDAAMYLCIGCRSVPVRRMSLWRNVFIWMCLFGCVYWDVFIGEYPIY